MTEFAVYTSMPNTHWCDVLLLPFDERPDPAMMDSARDEASAATCEQHGRLRSRTWTMPLSFPNQSRWYDATRRAVRFWGHDTAMEVSFFVTEDALIRIQPNMRLDEAGLLSVFDAHRNMIYAAAAKVYSRSRKGSYDLVSADF